MGKIEGYEDIDRIKDVDGIVAVISRRKSNGKCAVGFFHEFEREGNPNDLGRTAFIPENQLDAVLRLVSLSKTRLAELKTSKSKDKGADRLQRDHVRGSKMGGR
jgi:hypothetical protein